MGRSQHLTVSLDLDFDESLWAEAQTDNPMSPVSTPIPVNTTLKVDISVPPAIELANESLSPIEDGFSGEWAEMPEDMEALVEEALWQEAPPSSGPAEEPAGAPAPSASPAPAESAAPAPSDIEPAAAYGALSQRAREARSVSPKRSKLDRTALEISRAATWCALGLAASVLGGVVLPGPWAPAVVLAVVAAAFTVTQVGAALENADYKKVTRVAQLPKLSVAVPPVLGVVLSQIVPVELVAPGGAIPGVLLAVALGLFTFVWFAPTLQGLKVPKGLLVLVTTSAFSTAHIVAMLSARSTFDGTSAGCSVLVGLLFSAAYAIRPKPMEVMGAVILMMALLVV